MELDSLTTFTRYTCCVAAKTISGASIMACATGTTLELASTISTPSSGRMFSGPNPTSSISSMRISSKPTLTPDAEEKDDSYAPTPNFGSTDDGLLSTVAITIGVVVATVIVSLSVIGLLCLKGSKDRGTSIHTSTNEAYGEVRGKGGIAVNSIPTSTNEAYGTVRDR
ncbi:hypothetical protein GBAR_LOCUS4531, partial [Geodia barretti]